MATLLIISGLMLVVFGCKRERNASYASLTDMVERLDNVKAKLEFYERNF